MTFFFTVLQIKFEICQFASIIVGVMPLSKLRILEIQFSTLFPTCYDILSWNFAYYFVLIYYTASSSVINFRQFSWELCSFWKLEYWKYPVFHSFLLHAFTYCAEILRMTFFFTVLQIKFEICQFASIIVGVMPLSKLRILEIQFSTLFSYLLWHIELKFLHITLF